MTTQGKGRRGSQMSSPPERSAALDVYLSDMLHALKCGAPHSALAMALSIPDICGSIQYPDSKVGERYICWADEWAAMLTMSAADCYAMRCAYLHSASEVFSGPSARGHSHTLTCLLPSA